MHILKVYSIHYTLRYNTSVKKSFLWTKQMIQKMPSFFLHKPQLITVLLLICDSYMSWSTSFVSLKTVWNFPFLIPFRFYQSLNFCSTRYMDFLALKRLNSFQISNNRKTTNSFAPRPLIFKLQGEVLKFNDICVSWNSLKTDLETIFFNLRNRSFKNASFSQ